MSRDRRVGLRAAATFLGAVSLIGLLVWLCTRIVESNAKSDRIRRGHEHLVREVAELRSAVERGPDRLPIEEVARALAAIGVRWVEDDGTLAHMWCGTAFGVRGTDWLVTAAHVLEDAAAKTETLRERDLEADVVVRIGTSEAVVLEYRLHSRYRETHVATDRPAIDAAAFRVSSDAGLGRLAVADPPPRIGEHVFVSGYPTEMPHVNYPSGASSAFLPVVRTGFIERVVDVADLASDTEADLVQFGIPITGGFSGAPLVNVRGEVVGVVTFASHRLVDVADEPSTPGYGSGTVRIVDPLHVSFATSARHVRDLLQQLPEG